MNPTSSLVRSNACQAAFVFLCLGLLRANGAQAPASMISIWPGKPPGTESWTQQEEWYGDAMDGAVQGLHVRNTTTPGLSVYAAPRQIANGTAVIVAPGGGFTSEAWEKEGTLLAEWLQTKGVTSFVLKYRLTPQSAGGATARGGPTTLQIPGASPSQQTALTAMEQSVATLSATVTAARAELTRASLTNPDDLAGRRAKAEALGSAEQALASARAEAFAKLQAGTDKLGSDLVQALVRAQSGGTRGGAAGRGAAATTTAAGNTNESSIRAFAVADGQQAMRYVRSHAAEWGVDPTKLGFIGFSAGGYIALKLAVEHDAQTRPDFVGSVYGCCMGDEVEAPVDAPSLFLASAMNDAISFGVHTGLVKAWKAVNKPVEIHMYATGGHGFGMAKRGLPHDTWPERLGDWLRNQKLIGP